MSALDFAVCAAEFPNDNPLLHRGARWMCRATRGPARAVLRAELSEPSRVVERPAHVPAPPPRVYEGPLELDLDRIVIAHRVENVPPPPDFILEPFVASRPSAESPAPSCAPVVDARRCERVDEPEERRRVRRGARVDIAPCLSVEAAPEGVSGNSPRRGRRRAPTQARVLAASPLPEITELERAIRELEAAFAKPELHSTPHERGRVIPCPAGGA